MWQHKIIVLEIFGLSYLQYLNFQLIVSLYWWNFYFFSPKSDVWLAQQSWSFVCLKDRIWPNSRGFMLKILNSTSQGLKRSLSDQKAFYCPGLCMGICSEHLFNPHYTTFKVDSYEISQPSKFSHPFEHLGWMFTRFCFLFCSYLALYLARQLIVLPMTQLKGAGNIRSQKFFVCRYCSRYILSSESKIEVIW